MDNYYGIAFTTAVRELQEAKGSPLHSPQMVGESSPPQPLGQAEIAHITARDSLYLATVGETGWPYVQHRGGDVGFVKVIGEHTIGWIERTGNRQYIGAGNITADDRVALIMVDYPNRARLKLYGRASYHPHPTPELIAVLGGEKMRNDGAITMDVVACNWNCPKYITPRFTADYVNARLTPLQERIADLEAELATARKELERNRSSSDHFSGSALACGDIAALDGEDLQKTSRTTSVRVVDHLATCGSCRAHVEGLNCD